MGAHQISILAMQTWLGIPIRPEPGSTIAEGVDKLHFFLTGITLFFTFIIFSAILYFAIKYRRRSEDERPAADGNAPFAGADLDAVPHSALRGDLRMELEFVFCEFSSAQRLHGNFRSRETVDVASPASRRSARNQ